MLHDCKVQEYFGTFPCSLYTKPWHANADLFTMSDKWNITVWRKIPACESNTVMVVNQWLILISFLMSDKWDKTVSVHSFDRFHSPSIWWSSISHWYWFIFDGWKVNSTVCVEPFPQPMHMTVSSQLVITPAPISLKGNLVGDWTFLKERAWKQALKKFIILRTVLWESLTSY